MFREQFKAVVPAKCAECGDVREKGMNLAHKTHDPLRRDGRGLMWLCPSCHARHDTPQRVAMTRRTRAKDAGQLWLSPEIEYAPYPIWEIPADKVIEARQERIKE